MTIQEIHHLYLKSDGIGTDTRTLKKNTLFFSLSGKNFNGNQYAQKAIALGASYVIVDDKNFYPDNHKKYILVDNTLATLQDLATYHRNYLGIPIIALTGSNGKTTTKELILSVLSESFNITATQGNLNNHIGVPLTLLEMNQNTEIGVVEMGANHQKEIEFLCKIAQPDYGYITNIGKAHLEGFGGIEGVLKGKTELYQYLRNHDKMVFLNQKDVKLVTAAKGMHTYRFSEDTDADLQIENITQSDYISVKCNEVVVQSNLIGMYNFSNISCAIAIGNYFNIAMETIKKGIENYTPGNNRSQILHKPTYTILLDAYNANPSSMQVALDNFKQMNFNVKIVALGDMFELGKDTEKEHIAIAQYAINKKFERIILIGKHFSKVNLQHHHLHIFETKEEAVPLLQQYVKNTDALLLKGSRGMKLEELLEQI